MDDGYDRFADNDVFNMDLIMYFSQKRNNYINKQKTNYT